MYRAIAIFTGCVFVAGCTGFFKTAQVKLGARINGGTNQQQVSDGGTASLPDPYLTLTAYSNTDNLFAQKPVLSSDLQILKLDAEITDGVSGRSFSVPLLAYDVPGATEKTSYGAAILKAYPVRPDANGTVNIAFRSSAVEKNVADQFIAGLSLVQAVLPAGSLTPGASEAFDAASKVLSAFQSPSSAATSSVTTTINVSRDMAEQAFALFLIPTNAQGRSFVDQRNALSTMSFKICANRMDALCSVNNNVESPVLDFAYVIVVPSVTYKIRPPNFLWATLAGCSVSNSELQRYATELSKQEDFLTDDQKGAEREFAASVSRLIAVKTAVAQKNTGGILRLIDQEWASHREDTWLQRTKLAGSSYADKHDLVRSCITKAGDELKLGFFSEYADTLSALYSSNKAGYEQALKRLIGFKSVAQTYGMRDAALAATLAANEAILSERIFTSTFVEPISRLGDEQLRQAATQQLRLLIATSACASCKLKAQEALASVASALSSDAIAAGEVSSSAAALEGSLSLAQAMAKASGEPLEPELAQEVQATLENASKTVTGIVSEGKPAGSRVKTLEKELLRVNKALSHSIKIRF